jgi:hypothetical protein
MSCSAATRPGNFEHAGEANRPAAGSNCHANGKGLLKGADHLASRIHGSAMNRNSARENGNGPCT